MLTHLIKVLSRACGSWNGTVMFHDGFNEGRNGGTVPDTFGFILYVVVVVRKSVSDLVGSWLERSGQGAGEL